MFISKKLLALAALVLAAALTWSFLLPHWLANRSSEDAGSRDFPVVMRIKGGMLEVGTIRHRQTLSLTSAFTLLGYTVPFCRERSAYTFDSFMTYRVKLADRWVGDYHGGRFAVVAPALKPALPVAFDTTKLESELSKCLVAPSLGTQAQLLRSLSGRLQAQALDPGRVAFIKRNGAADTVREFVQTWMLKQRKYDIPAGTPIDVSFADD